MAKQGISTGTTPNDGAGDTLLSGAEKIISNFDEIYTLLGDGNTLSSGVVKSITAGSNISVSGATGDVTITGVANTAHVSADSLVVAGIATFNDFLRLPSGIFNNNQIQLGNSQEFTLQYNSASTQGILRVLYNPLLIGGSTLTLGSNTTKIEIDDSVELYYGSGSKKLETTIDGVDVTGICSATEFTGDGSNLVDGKWNLGADGISDYTFTGIGFTQTTSDPVLYLARGRVYEFVNTMNAHPFQIRVSNGGSAYNSGVSTTSVSNGTLRFEIPMDAPNTLYYQCTSHPGMGNTISVYPNTI